MVGRIVEDMLDHFIDCQFVYPLYIKMTLDQKKQLRAALRRSIRETLIPTQMSFYVALAHHLLGPDNQYHSDLINTPIYNWARRHLFHNNPVDMLFYLTKVKKENPNG